MNKLILTIGLLFSISTGFTQIYNPVKWNSEIKTVGEEYELIFTANIEPGWAVYSQYLESDEGPVATSINYENKDFELVGKAEEEGHRKEGFDALFDMNVIKFTEEFTIKQKIKAKSGTTIKGYISFMTCDDTKCLPPSDVDFSLVVSNTPNTSDKDGAVIEMAPENNSLELSGNLEDIDIQTIEGFSMDDQEGIYEPVEWQGTYDAEQNEVIFSALIDEGWHIYDQVIEGDDGPIPTEFYFNDEKQVLSMESIEIIEEIDEFFGGILIKKLKKEAQFRYPVPDVNSEINGEILYMACNKDRCTPPMTINFTIDPNQKIVILQSESAELWQNADAGMYPVPPVDLSNPVGECGDVEIANVARKTLLNIFFLGFIGGLLALLTPCVFPMIPLTVSFFTKNSGNRKSGIRQAFLYGFFILMVYLLLSIPFHLLDTVNPGILNDISTNVGLNIFFFVIFVFFAFSFFGFYEISLPSRWTNRVSNAESVGGLVGVFFMALTLALVSFSCTGPILGSLLAGALTSEGGAMQLTAGMGGFGLALALPFALFAAFPTMLSALPKSGGWLNTVKVVLGFLELALAFKFLSNADLVKHWGLLKIEPFLAIWILVFLGLSVYLFGKWKFPHDSPIKKLSPWRVLSGLASLGFAIYLMTGFSVDQDKGTFKSLTLLSGLAPPAGYSWLHPKACPNNLDCFKDLSEGVAFAKKVGKPIMIDFTGHACVNCRKMEEQVWPEESVNQRLQNDFILISLYVDEKIELPEDQKTDRMKNYGQKWTTFQTQYFNNNSQPFYVLLSPEGKLLNNPVGYTPDAEDYAAFLECGLTAYKEIKGQDQLGAAD